MMQPWDVYLIHNACKLHFTTDSYDALKYNFKTSARQKSFFARKDKFFFAKLAKQYPEKQQVIDFFVANFTKFGDVYTWQGKPEYEEAYVDWKKRMESLTYLFTQDVDKLASWCESQGMGMDAIISPQGQSLPISKLWIEQTVSLETVVILDILTDFMSRANNQITETIFWPDFFRKVNKYRPFLRVDRKKYRQIVLKRFTN